MKKKIKLTVALFWIVICAVFGFFSPTIPFVKEFFEIKKVYVKGTDKFTKEDIKKIFEKENWFFINKDEVISELKKFNFVKDAEINRLFVGNIDLIILERKPFAILRHGRKSYLIDADGVRLSPKYYPLKRENQLPVLVYNDKSIDRSKLSKVNLIKKEFDSIFHFRKFYINKSQIGCITGDGKNIVFSSENLDKSIRQAKIFIKKVDIKKFRYLDFSFESMVIARR